MPDNPVETHYTSTELGETILAALKAAGEDLDHLSPDDLAPVDEFHGGQRPATVRLADECHRKVSETLAGPAKRNGTTRRRGKTATA